MTSASMKSSQAQSQSGPPTTDEAQVRAAQAGDVQAFSALVETHQRLARAIAFSVTSDYHITEDLAQEAMVTAWLRISDLGDPSKFRPWLASIVRNTARYWRRHQRRHAPRAQSGLEVLDFLPNDDQDSPLESAIDREGRVHARDAFEALPRRYKEPLLLYYCLDESHEQVASVLGVSEAAVRQRLCRARKKLKQDVSGLERTGRRLRNQVSAAAAVLLMIQSRQSVAATAAPAGKASFLASPKFFMGLGALAGGALVACVGAIVFYVSAGSEPNNKVGIRETQGRELSTGGVLAPSVPQSLADRERAAAAEATTVDSRGLVRMGTGRVKEKSERSLATITSPSSMTSTLVRSVAASRGHQAEAQNDSTPRGGRVHKHGPARLQTGADPGSVARPLLKPTLNLKEVQRELWLEK